MNNNIESNKVRAKKKSVGALKDVPYKKHRMVVKRALIIGGIVALVTAGGATYGGYKVYDSLHNSFVVGEQIEKGRDIVNENDARTDNNQGWQYNDENIAKELVKDPEHFDTNLYGVFKTIGYNEKSQLEQMEKVMTNVNKIATNSDEDLGLDYKNFTDYCIKKGFITDDGKIDLDAYRKTIEDQIVKEVEVEKLQEEINNFKSR